MAEEFIERGALIARYDAEHVGPPGRARELMATVPAADVATVVHGRWLCVDTDTEQFFLCNRCKKKEYWESKYCPNCGAKMDKEEE